MTARRTMPVALLGLLASLAAPRHAAGLATEQLGSDPIGPGLGFGAEILAAVNAPARVYWYEVNGNPFFFFSGTLREANEAIRRFAAIPAAKREIILLPGPGETRTLVGKKRVPYDWCLHTPLGLRFIAEVESSDDRNTLTIHVAAPRPAVKANPADVRRWIADLNNDAFKTREQAAQSLEALGSAVAPALREALKSAASPEARERIERLIKRLRRIELDLLELPADVPVVGIDTLLERCRKDLSNKDPQVRG